MYDGVVELHESGTVELAGDGPGELYIGLVELYDWGALVLVPGTVELNVGGAVVLAGVGGAVVLNRNQLGISFLFFMASA